MGEPKNADQRRDSKAWEISEYHAPIPWNPDDAIILSPEDYVAFLQACLTPSEPNAKLKEDVQRYREFLRDNAID